MTEIIESEWRRGWDSNPSADFFAPLIPLKLLLKLITKHGTLNPSTNPTQKYSTRQEKKQE